MCRLSKREGTRDGTDRDGGTSDNVPMFRLPDATSSAAHPRSTCVRHCQPIAQSHDSRSRDSRSSPTDTRSSWLLTAKEFDMYAPTLARFTALDPMPPDGEPVLLGASRYEYAEN